jgi:hypothetical protein
MRNGSFPCPRRSLKESCGGALITPWLNQNVDYTAVLIHRSPKIVLSIIDSNEKLRPSASYRRAALEAALDFEHSPNRTSGTRFESFHKRQ